MRNKIIFIIVASFLLKTFVFSTAEGVGEVVESHYENRNAVIERQINEAMGE